MTLTPISFKKGRGHKARLSAPYVPGRHSRKFWTDAEDSVLREHYPNGGQAACLAHLPNRSRGAIYQRARDLMLSTPPAPRQKHGTAFDEIIRERWPGLKGRGAVARLADELGVGRVWLSSRALRLGLTVPHKKEPPWTPAEDALLEKVPLHDPKRCATIFREHGFSRSPAAIMVRCKRRQLSRRFKDTFSARAASEILGVDHKTFATWCAAGDVKAGRRGTDRLPQQGGDTWSIAPADLRAFVLANLDRIDIRKVEKFAFVKLLVGEELQ